MLHHMALFCLLSVAEATCQDHGAILFHFDQVIHQTLTEPAVVGAQLRPTEHARLSVKSPPTGLQGAVINGGVCRKPHILEPC